MRWVSRLEGLGVSSLKASRGGVGDASSSGKGGKSAGKVKALAGSALSQSRSSKATSESVVRSAAKVLADPRSSKLERRSAASVLSQKEPPFPVKAYRVAGSTLTQAKGASIVRKVAKKAVK